MARRATKPKPVLNLRFGSMNTAIWENKNRDDEVFHTCELRRSYRDHNDEWQDQSMTMSISDIAKAAFALQETFKGFYLMKDESRRKPQELER